MTIWQNTWTFTRTAARPDGNLWIFWTTETSAVVGSYIWKIYTYKVYDASTDELVADLVPCLNSLSVPWFYDVVGNTFYPKTAWTWTISAWPTVQAEWLEISVDDSVFTTDSVTWWTDIEIVTQAWRGLPTWYTEVEYLQSSWTQWIHTWITGNVSSTRTLKSDVGVRYDTVPAADTCLLWSRTGNIRAYMVYCYMWWCLWYGAQYRWAWNITTETKYFTTTEYKESSQTFDVNGLRTMSYTDNMPFTTDLNMYLFAINEWWVAKRFQSAKVYYAKIYVNDVLEFDWVPAKRNSDNALWIYDMVTETFLTNQWSWTFTAWPVVQPWTVINFTNDSWYVTAADIPTYTAGTGIAISNNQISSTVLDFTNLTYDSLASDTWTWTWTVAFPSTAKVAFVSWRATDWTTIYAAWETIFPRTNWFIKSSFVWWWTSSSKFVSWWIMYDYQAWNIVYTKTDWAWSVNIQYSIYFYK